MSLGLQITITFLINRSVLLLQNGEKCQPVFPQSEKLSGFINNPKKFRITVVEEKERN